MRSVPSPGDELPKLLRWILDELKRKDQRIAVLSARVAALEGGGGGGGGGATGPAGGVLAGTYPDPGFAVDMATQAELDLKANAANPVFTGTVTVPDGALAIADTSGLQAALDAKAADADVVHDTGAETIAGVKTFSSDPIIPDEAYDATAWNGVLEPPTKNAVRDEIESLASELATSIADGDASTLTSAQSYADGKVDNTVYGAGWDGDTTDAPSKNAVYDKIQSMGGGSPALLVESGSESKVSALTELTTFSGDETFYVVEDDDGTPAPRRVTVENLAAGLKAYVPGALLAVTNYDPASQADPSSSSATYADVDATNLVLPSFVVPASGAVIIVLSSNVSNGTSGNSIGWNIRDGSGDVADTNSLVHKFDTSTSINRPTYRRYKSGLTPGATISGWKWGFARTSGTGSVLLDYGGATMGPALMEVYAA